MLTLCCNTKMKASQVFKALFVVLSFSALVINADCDNGHYYRLPTLREQAKLQDEWTQSRVDAIPALLEKHGVDAWLVRTSSYIPSKMT